jgi:predicted site-specific integrase-resolvase
METYIPIGEASKIFSVADSVLLRWIELGRIRGAMINSTGVIVNELDIEDQLPKEEQPKYKAVAHLKGTPIGVREASRKYLIPHQTITRWIEKGYIKTLGEQTVQGGRKLLLDEADVAYCAAFYHDDPRQGKKLFNDDGTPYHKK